MVTATAGTKLYHDAAFRYSVQYPASFHQPSSSPFTTGVYLEDVYFSNEDVDSPIGLGPNGVWVTIRVARLGDESVMDFASRHPYASKGTTVSDVRQLSVSGEPAIQQEEDAIEPGHAEVGFSVATYVAKDGVVYSILMLAPYQTVLVLHRLDYDVFVASFELV